MLDTSTPQGLLFTRMLKRLGTRQRRYNLLNSYYENTCALPVNADPNVRESYHRLMQFCRTNFAELVVEAVRERMNPVGFRTGADGDENGDKEAWAIWQANSLDADSKLVHRAQLTMGEAYVIVGPVDDDLGVPVITPEDPRQVITEHDPIRRRKTVAALKVFHDDTAGVDRGYLYLPGEVWRAKRPRGKSTAFTYTAAAWEWDLEEDEPGVTLPGVVPVVRFVNRANLANEPTGEFETHRSILDRINYTVLNRVEIATMQAFKQRAIKGLPKFDENGLEIDYSRVFESAPGAIWNIPEIADIWESKEVDLSGIRSAVRDDIQDLAAVTRTPLFYLTPEAANGSAEGASLAREGLVFKALDRLTETGESWEQVEALAFAYMGDEQRAKRADMEIMWASPERFSLAERYDAASKAQAAGVPWRETMTYILGFSPQEVDRMEAERNADLLRAAALASTATGAVVAAQNAGVPDPAVRITETGTNAPATV